MGKWEQNFWMQGSFHHNTTPGSRTAYKVHKSHCGRPNTGKTRYLTTPVCGNTEPYIDWMMDPLKVATRFWGIVNWKSRKSRENKDVRPARFHCNHWKKTAIPTLCIVPKFVIDTNCRRFEWHGPRCSQLPIWFARVNTALLGCKVSSWKSICVKYSCIQEVCTRSRLSKPAR